MPLETEAKFRVASHEPVRKGLQTSGATFDGRVLETNWIFDRPDGSLRRQGYGLRIRTASGEGTGEQSATLTVKGPVLTGPFKSREELELRISDAETAARMLHILSFVPILEYQKRRESWRLGECRIELDEPPRIGLFVEIEGPDEAAIRTAQGNVGLGDAVHVQASYVRMLAAYCNEHGITDRILHLPGLSTPQT